MEELRADQIISGMIIYIKLHIGFHVKAHVLPDKKVMIHTDGVEINAKENLSASTFSINLLFC